MTTHAETIASVLADRPAYSCVRCQHPLTRREAWLGRQRSGMPGYYCATHAPAGSIEVAR